MPTLNRVNRYSPCKIWKKSIDNAYSFAFFHNIGPNFAQILPQDHTHFDFLAGFQWNMLLDSININNVNWNPEVLKKIAKTSKLPFFVLTCAKMGFPWATPKTKTIFLAEVKPDHKLSKTFYFSKISCVLADLWMFFYFVQWTCTKILYTMLTFLPVTMYIPNVPNF